MELLTKVQESPNRFQREEKGKWHCPPAEKHASELELYYVVCSDAYINSTFLRNFVWLEDYFQDEPLEVDEEVISAVHSLVEAEPGIALAQVIHGIEAANVDDLNILVATNQLYVDLNTAPLSRPEQVNVFLNEEEAFTYVQVMIASVQTSVSFVGTASAGTAIYWDGQQWEILNTGDNFVGMLGASGQYKDLPNSVFEALVEDGKITRLQVLAESTFDIEAEALLHKASQRDRAVANDRYKAIEAFLNGTSSTQPNRSQYRWMASYLKANKVYGRGFLGLLPQHQNKGNHLPKMSESVRLLMAKHIEEEYETLKQPSIRQAYGSFKELCEQQGRYSSEHGTIPPSGQETSSP